MRSYYVCPQCGSSSINQFRTPNGAMWCADCDFKVEHKESDDSFKSDWYKDRQALSLKCTRISERVKKLSSFLDKDKLTPIVKEEIEDDTTEIACSLKEWHEEVLKYLKEYPNEE